MLRQGHGLPCGPQQLWSPRSQRTLARLLPRQPAARAVRRGAVRGRESGCFRARCQHSAPAAPQPRPAAEEGLRAELAALREVVESLERKLATPIVEGRERDVAAMTLEQLTKQRNMKYSKDLQVRMVELLSLQAGALPVGSHKYLCMAYPGDIDLCEVLVYPETSAREAAERVAERIQIMARRDLGLYPIVTLEKQLPNMIGNLV
jgi:hypothetical protein